MSKPCELLHGQIIKFEELEKTVPNRNKFLDRDAHKKVKSNLNKCKTIMFMPSSTYDTKPQQSAQYEKSKYKLVLFGVFEDGSRGTVIINDIEPYFEIKIPDSVKNKEGFAEDMFSELSMEGNGDFNKFIHTIEVHRKLPTFGFKIEPLRYEIVMGKPLHVYQEHESSYVRIYFNKMAHRNDAIEYVRALKYQTAHDDLNCYYRVVSRDYFLKLGYWMTLKNYFVDTTNSYIKGEVLQISIDDIKSFDGELPKHLEKDNTMSMAFDIETFNADDDGEIPMPEFPNHNMFMISMTFQWYTAPDQLLSVCLVDVPTNAHPDFLTVVCNTEENLIRAFGQLCNKLQPEFIMGFNSDNYDWKWIVVRAQKYSCLLTELVENLDCSIVKDRNDRQSLYCYKKSTIKIEATASVDGENIQVPGFIPFDVMTMFRKLYPTSEVWNLNFFLKKNKLGGKEDMPYQEMFRIYRETLALRNAGKAITDILLDEMALVGKYCVIDSIRCHDLTNIRNVIQDKRELANLSYTSIYDAFYRADGMKVRNLTIAEANLRNLKISNIANKKAEDGKYIGAWVFPPIKGLVISKLNISERITKAHLGYVEYKDWLDTTEDEIKQYIEIIETVGATPSQDDLSKLEIHIPKHVKKMLLEPIGRPITGLDYASLYPSLMMCFNLSPEYMILNKTQAKHINDLVDENGNKVHELHKVKFDYNERVIRGWSIRHDNKLDPSKPDFKFGLFPSILKRLFDDRKKLKKGARGLLYWEHEIEKMKLLSKEELESPEVKDAYEDAKFAYNALDSKQKALKVYMNTFYGESGNKRSPLFMLQIAGGITTAGRDNIKRAYNFVEERECKVFYGDSVTADTPIIIQYIHSNNIDIKTIDDIPSIGTWVEYPQFKSDDMTLVDKQQMLCKNINTWTSQGWKRIVRVIRHKTNKRMFRINTSIGSVDVTEDHSLLTWNCTILSSKDAKVGDKLLHGFPKSFYQQDKPSMHNSYIINNVVDCICGNEYDFIQSINFVSLLNSPRTLRKFFVDSIIKKRAIGYNILVHSKLVAQIIYYLFKSVNYYTFIHADNNNAYILTYSDDLNRLRNIQQIPDIMEILNIIELPAIDHSEYVYDIETCDGTFLAGIGEICVKNTDSLYLAMPEKEFKQIDIDYYTEKISKLNYWKRMIEITFETIVPLNQAVNKMLEENNGTKFLNMAFEESIYPYVSFAKKKYMGIPHISEPNYNKDENGDYYLFIKGLALKTRGVSDVLVQVCQKILQKIVDPYNILTIMEIVQKTIIDFYESDWTSPEKFNAFIMTGVYKPNKKNVKMHTFHDRMLQEYGIKLIPGDRIQYVVTKKYPYKFDYRGRKKALSIGDKMELADKAQEEGIPIDIDYYMDKNINGQLARFITYHDDFQVVVKDYDDKVEVKKAEADNLKLARKFIDDFCKRFYVKYSDKGGIYKNIFKKSSNIVKRKLIETCGDNTSNEIIELLGFSVDPDDNLEEWLLTKVVKFVEGKKLNKTYGADYVDNLLSHKSLKELNKSKSIYTAELQYAFYANKKSNISQMVETTFCERQQILEHRLRQSINIIRNIYHTNNKIIENVADYIKSATNIDQNFNTGVETTEELAKDIDSYLVTNGYDIDDFTKTLDDVATQKIKDQSDKILAGINELKMIYINLVSNYEYIYRMRSIIDYLKKMRNRTIGLIKPPPKQDLKKMIASMIKETVSETKM